MNIKDSKGVYCSSLRTLNHRSLISSTSVRELFEYCSAVLRDTFETASGQLRVFFGCASTILRLRLEELSKRSRRAVEPESNMVGRRVVAYPKKCRRIRLDFSELDFSEEEATET
ncbi:hypothetical protein [Sphingobacterium wenxiniae]|uniref:hypothetical protein n=1 Tax=Sphingobacterium wenxiniae TaxID=683125 RepID=UPI0011136B11|nr:hypothetical protein [Sphingobacterium wenxiniae]